MTGNLPAKIRLEASSFCQLKCPSCPTATGAINAVIGGGFLRREDFRSLLDSNPWLRGIELSNYGEVFLNPHLEDILAYAAEKNVAITISNGANLNQVREEVLEALVKYRVRTLRCSIDGASPETYVQYRVRGDFDRVIANVKRINDYKRQYRSRLPHLTWQFVVFGHNEHEIPVARKMAASLGMDFATKISWDSEISPIRDRAFVLAQTRSDAVTREEYQELHGSDYAGAICQQLWNNPQINWDGKLLGCCRNFWGDFGGNAFTQGLGECLNSEKLNYARAMLMGEKPARADIPCTTCDIYLGMEKRSQWIKPTASMRSVRSE